MLIAIILKNVFLLYYHYFENTLRRKISGYHAKLLYEKFINQSYLNHTLMDSADIQNNILYQSQKCSDFVFYSMMFIKESLIAIILIITLLLVNIKASIFLLILKIE